MKYSEARIEAHNCEADHLEVCNCDDCNVINVVREHEHNMFPKLLNMIKQAHSILRAHNGTENWTNTDEEMLDMLDKMYMEASEVKGI